MNIGDMIAPRVSFGEALRDLAPDYPKLLVFDSDVSPSTRTQLFAEAYPERFYQMGIAEQNMVCSAAGMATTGWMPMVSTFAVFLAKRAVDQVRVSVAQTKLNVKLNGAYGGLPTGRAGKTHAAVQDIAVMRAMPNMVVVVPADPMETKLAVKACLDFEGPVYLRTVRDPVPVIFGEDHVLEIGKSYVLHEGDDLAIISTGMMTPKALVAAEQLKKEGIGVRLVHMPTIKPIDRTAIVKASNDFGKILSIENHSVIGGLGGAISEVLTDEAPCLLKRLGFQDRFAESGDNEAIFSAYGMNSENIVEAAKAFV
ncbi:MAG: transketolase C-terminal domain-containing protein [Kiritimatiellia bacterium]|nr:transketolase C-terminal domain-containing protein [Kiritimatiellia bacterium]